MTSSPPTPPRRGAGTVSTLAAALLASLLPTLATTPVAASRVARFALDTPEALANAHSRGVAMFPDGSLVAMPPLEQVATFEEPLGLALAVGEDGTAYVGTGHPARVWRCRQGEKTLLAELNADQVTALLIAPDGTLWAATAVPATLLRFSRSGSPTVASTLPEGNLWDLAWFRGELVAAAGNPGRLLRLGANGFELAAPVPDRHARCLAVAGEFLLVGTSGRGLVLRWTGEGSPGVLFDSPFSEIAALAAEPSGVVWAAALTGDPTLGAATKGGSEPTVTTATETPSTSADTQGAVAEILRILPQGTVTTAHRFPKQLATTLDIAANGPVIGTGLEGELWQLVEGVPARLDTVAAAQVTRLARGGHWVLTQGPTALFHRQGAPAGTFTSPPLDAGQPSRWGEVEVRASTPGGGRCTIELRSGATAEPDDTWSPWSQPFPCGHGTASLPPARYAQWRLQLAAPPTGRATVAGVTLAYRQLNLPPELRAITVHEPGQVFLKSPPPSDRIVEVQHPDLSGIFTTLDEDASEQQSTLGKLYYRVGYQTVSWSASDPNGDPLRFDVEIAGEGWPEFVPVRRNLESALLSLDTQALADGIYRFRISASDADANPEEPGRSSRLSPAFVVDNTPPLVQVVRRGEWWLVTVEDARSPILRLEWNRDGDAWHPLTPEDGLLDGRTETFRLRAESGRHILSLRAVDDHHNRTTVAVEEGP